MIDIPYKMNRLPTIFKQKNILILVGSNRSSCAFSAKSSKIPDEQDLPTLGQNITKLWKGKEKEVKIDNDYGILVDLFDFSKENYDWFESF
jgi:hypothetical protein